MPAKKRSGTLRDPVVAGVFYPAQKGLLADIVDRSCRKPAVKEDLLAVVAPHGGYLSSAAVAGAAYSCSGPCSAAVIVGPKHTKVGSPFALVTEGVWKTPFGQLRVHQELAEVLLEEADGFLEKDAAAHREDHSIELQLPFLQRMVKIRRFVPVLLSEEENPSYREIGQAIARALKRGREKGKVLLVATCDLTRYEPQEIACRKDRLVIQSILGLNDSGLVETAGHHSVSMCGAYSVATVLAAAKALGASAARLVSYKTSGDATGEYESVVGYAGITIS